MPKPLHALLRNTAMGCMAMMLGAVAQASDYGDSQIGRAHV